MPLPKIGYPTYELELPSTGKKIKYRPFLVKEEKVLLLTLEERPQPGEDKEKWDKWEDQVKLAVKDLIKNCVISRINVEDLPSFDLEYLFMKIRAAAIGEIIVLTVTCDDDGVTQVDVPIDVNKIEVKKNPDHTNKWMISDDVGIVMKYPSMDRFIDSEFLNKDIKTDELFEFIAEHIDQVFEGDEVQDSADMSKKEVVEWLQTFTSAQFEGFETFYKTMPKYQHTFTATNPNTGVESEYTLEGMSSFFA